MKKKKLLLLSPDYALITGYAVAFLLLLTSYFLTLYSNKELKQQTQLVTHTNNIIKDVATLLSATVDGETGIRGYINTKDTVFLEPYYKSIGTVDDLLNTVEEDTKNDPELKQNIGLLKTLILKKYYAWDLAIRNFIANNYTQTDSMIKGRYASKATMDSVRLIAHRVQAYENDILNTRYAEVKSRYTASNIIVIVSLLLAFIFAAFGVISFARENKARRQADQKVASYQQDLRERIIELNSANRRLKEMQREEKFASTGRIARIIAHEVRNPLTNIDLAIAQIKDELGKENKESDFLFDVIIRNSNRINQLITELLNSTRVTELSFEKASVHHLLDESISLAADRIELNNIKLQKKFDKDMPGISLDASKIKIAFLNLFINAIESMKDSKEKLLTIITRVENNKCVVEIIDTGIGMDSVGLTRLFEAYYTTKPKGNGLGLTNTQNIILNHNGSIDVESKPGVGSRFILKFDIA